MDVRIVESTRPGWPEIGVAVVAAVVLYLAGFTAVLAARPGTPALEGLMYAAVSGLVPIVAFAVTVLVRIRDVRVFGMRRVEPRWLLVAAGFAVGCFVVIRTFDVTVETLFPGVDDAQGPLRAASAAGPAYLIGTILFVGVLTPFGEELLFRGVLARFLGCWGTWVTVLVGALVFALFHGINLVFPSAFLVGLCCAWMLHRTASVWPGVVLHVLYNTAFLLLYAVD